MIHSLLIFREYGIDKYIKISLAIYIYIYIYIADFKSAPVKKHISNLLE